MGEEMGQGMKRTQKKAQRTKVDRRWGRSRERGHRGGGQKTYFIDMSRRRRVFVAGRRMAGRVCAQRCVVWVSHQRAVRWGLDSSDLVLASPSTAQGSHSSGTKGADQFVPHQCCLQTAWPRSEASG